MNNNSIFMEEQKGIIQNLQKRKEIRKFILWELLGFLMIFGISYIIPTIDQEKHIYLFCTVFLSSIVLAIVDLIVTLKFIEKEKVVNILYFVMCFLMGVILKICYINGSIKNIAICSAIVFMYYTVVAIIGLQKKKLLFIAVPFIFAILYLGYKYLTFNACIIIIVLNTVSFSFIFLEAIKKLTNEPKKEDIITAKLVFLIIFIVENIFLSNII